LRLFSFGGYGLALAALALIVFGAIECPPFNQRAVAEKTVRRQKSTRNYPNKNGPIEAVIGSGRTQSKQSLPAIPLNSPQSERKITPNYRPCLTFPTGKTTIKATKLRRIST